MLALTGTFADVMRLIILILGFSLALACVKFAWLAIKGGEPYRAWGLASYGFLVITPAIVAINRFEQPLIWPSALTYFLGLICGVMALRKSYTVSPEWRRLRRERQAARQGNAARG